MTDTKRAREALVRVTSNDHRLTYLIDPSPAIADREALHAALDAIEKLENMASVGRELLRATRTNCPDWAPMDCPSEIVVDLVNERDELQSRLESLEALLPDVRMVCNYNHGVRDSLPGSRLLAFLDGDEKAPAPETKLPDGWTLHEEDADGTITIRKHGRLKGALYPNGGWWTNSHRTVIPEAIKEAAAALYAEKTGSE